MSKAGNGWSSVAICHWRTAGVHAALLMIKGFEVNMITVDGEVHVQVATGLVDEACALLFGGRS